MLWYIMVEGVRELDTLNEIGKEPNHVSHLESPNGYLRELEP